MLQARLGTSDSPPERLHPIALHPLHSAVFAGSPGGLRLISPRLRLKGSRLFPRIQKRLSQTECHMLSELSEQDTHVAVAWFCGPTLNHAWSEQKRNISHRPPHPALKVYAFGHRDLAASAAYHLLATASGRCRKTIAIAYFIHENQL